MRYYDYSPVYNHASFWDGDLFSMILRIAFWIAIVWLIVKVFQHFSQKKNEGSCDHEECCKTKDGAVLADSNKYLDIVKERYAKGEINTKEFEELKKGLSE